jgi:glycine/D-amino acid oxidase-like deaminating enzyme
LNSTFKAIRLPRQTGPAGWNRLLPEAPPPRVLEKNVTANITIIGAGFAGLSAAKRLHELDSKLKVVVLEAGRVGDGPAGRNSGFMIDLPHHLSSESYSGDSARSDRREIARNRLAIGYAARIAAELDMSREVFDPVGRINAAATARGDRYNREFARHLESLGESCETLDKATMREVTGSANYSSGLFTPGTVMIQPAAYIRDLAGLVGRTAALYENSPALGIRREGNGWRVSTPGGAASTDTIILANNGHAESLGFFRRRLLHVFTYASMTEPFPDGILGGEPAWGVTSADPAGTTVRRISGTGGNRIVIRSRFTCNPSMEAGSRAIAAAGAQHRKRLLRRFPQLEGVGMAWCWAGHLCLSRNGVPAHGEVIPGVFSAVCQNGLGTARGTLAGISAADLALGRSSEYSSAMNGYAEPAKLPPPPLTWAGASLLMRWREWRAGGE